MDALFYFTKSRIGLDEIAAVAAQAGYQAERLWFPAGALLSITGAEEGPWQWSVLSEAAGDFRSFEPANRSRVSQYGPSSAFQIDHHALSWATLRVFLRRILDQYGGWVGCDTPDFTPIYTAENVLEEPYPLQVQAVAASRGP